MAKHHLTKEWQERLLKELNTLRNDKLPRILDRMKSAIEQWDVSENAELDSTIQEKEFAESRISELENFLQDVEIIEKDTNIDKVQYGCIVSLKNEEGKELSYEIVGSWEVDIFENRISINSPVGESIKNKKVGDKVSVNSPRWEYDLEITAIK